MNTKKNYAPLAGNALIILLILAGLVMIQINDARFYKHIVSKQVESEAKMTSGLVTNHIVRITEKQRVVSEMIANDTFFRRWISNMEKRGMPSQDAHQLYDYLKEYQKNYGYDVIFFVSAKSGKYYYQDGLNKVLHKEDPFDSWYYNFLALNRTYDIQIDRDEINDYSVSLFVNYRITDEDGNLLGVVGCGSHIDDFQKQIAAYEEEDKLRIYITNIGNAHNSYTGNTQNYRQLHDLEKDLGITREEILKDEGMSYVQKDQQEYVVLTHHIDELNWDVVVVKETATLLDAFLSRLNATIFNTFIFVGLFAVGISFALTRINERQIEQENMDELTGLANRRLFERKLRRILRKHHKKGRKMSFFILDIDDFKQFNDELGHLYGNSVLQLVGQTLKGLCRDVGLPARWGGDEFTGILFLPEEEAKVALEKIDGILRQEEMQMPVHVSVGITEIRQQDTKEEMLRRADSALYTSKKRGKAQCTIYREE